MSKNRPGVYDLKVLSIDELEREASRKLSKIWREYFNEGAENMITLHDNIEAFRRYKIRPRVLINVSEVDTSTEIFGTRISFPLSFSPAAIQKMAHPDGELATSRAAAKAGICMGVSSYATTSLEDVAAQGNGNPYVIQVSMLKNRETVRVTLRRAEAAGFKAVFLTVDSPVVGLRLNEYRNELALPEGIGYPNMSADPSKPFGYEGGDPDEPYDTAATWDETIPWLRSQTRMQIWLKGVYTPEDVALAIRHGLDGVVISNHGGRQLDGVPATLDTLRDVAPAAAGKMPIAIDGGIRRGSDIFKALALGAQHCFVGRVPIWGLAYNGQEGVELAIRILLTEFKTTMALAGCRSVREITRAHLCVLGANGALCKL